MDNKSTPFIVISGNICSGKTTLIQNINEILGWNVCIENVQDYLYIEKFYADMQQWGFHHQLQCILHKFKQQAIISNSLKPII
ncbi:deoxynucleoside kinase, partial [uncultured Nostoc sp.]|uniref:deoxynucleoside kinase n=1 Tax=uncultured Nostoc sp. TaxID=340711 RepID=UPI0035CC95D1